jgi:hypothetical protein
MRGSIGESIERQDTRLHAAEVRAAVGVRRGH